MDELQGVRPGWRNRREEELISGYEDIRRIKGTADELFLTVWYGVYRLSDWPEWLMPTAAASDWVLAGRYR